MRRIENVVIVQRPASGVWEGLASKLERFRASGGAAAPSDWSATWAARLEDPADTGAATRAREHRPGGSIVEHLGCYGTALAHRLAESGVTVRALQVRAAVSASAAASRGDDLPADAADVQLEVRVHAPGLDQGALRLAALGAQAPCQSWQALATSGRLGVQAYTIEPGAEQPIPPVLEPRR